MLQVTGNIRFPKRQSFAIVLKTAIHQVLMFVFVKWSNVLERQIQEKQEARDHNTKKERYSSVFYIIAEQIFARKVPNYAKISSFRNIFFFSYNLGVPLSL